MIDIVACADIHGAYMDEQYTQWFHQHPADLFLFAGDFQYSPFEDGIEFFHWIKNLPYKEKVIVFGNHDINYEYVQELASQVDNIHVLMNESITIFGIKIFGSPNILPVIGPWVFKKTEKELHELYKSIPDDTQILVTHTPAFEILDMAYGGVHAGSISLRDRISELPRLRYHIFGHIHEAEGGMVVKTSPHLYIAYNVGTPVKFSYDDKRKD